MSHLNSRNSMLVLAQALLLCACGSSGDTQQAARPQEGNVPAQSAVPEAAPAPASAPVASPAASQQGAPAMREFIDPVTGQHREPTAAELKALETARPTVTPNAATTSRPRDKEIVFPNGTVAVEESSMSQMKGCVQKDGSVTVDHDCNSTAPAPVKKP